MPAPALHPDLTSPAVLLGDWRGEGGRLRLATAVLERTPTVEAILRRGEPA